MLTPSAAQPLPDVLSDGQGSGRLCAADETDCDPGVWAGVTRVLDRLVDEQGVTVVKSAGNRGDGDDNTMTVPGETWNGITVGNIHAFDWTSCTAGATRQTHRIYRTSSVTPASPGPRLLDLVAPGVRIGTTGVNPAYCRTVCDRRADLPCTFCQRLGATDTARDGYWKVNSGTRPVAAVVGAMARSLIDDGLRDPKAVKALLINGADTWTSQGAPHSRVRGNDSGCAGDRIASRHGPYRHGSHYDRSYGWGYLNPAHLIADRPHTTTGTVKAGTAVFYAVTLEAWDSITLVWHRHADTCRDCASNAPPAPTPLQRHLRASATGALIDRDTGRTALDTVLQVSNGRRPDDKPQAPAMVISVEAPATESFALASARADTADGLPGTLTGCRTARSASAPARGGLSASGETRHRSRAGWPPKTRLPPGKQPFCNAATRLHQHRVTGIAKDACGQGVERIVRAFEHLQKNAVSVDQQTGQAARGIVGPCQRQQCLERLGSEGLQRATCVVTLFRS